MNCCKDKEEYFCCICFSQHVDRFERDYIHEYICWGLGFSWQKFPRYQQHPGYVRHTAGCGCFAGLCCLLFGDSAEGFYDHEKEKNACKNIDIYSICGYCNYNTGEVQPQLNVRTPCYGFTKELQIGSAKVEPQEGMTKAPRISDQADCIL